MATDILKGKTSKILISMSLPISLGMLSTFLFQVIDTYFVGQLGADALAALSFSATVYFVVVGLFIGLAVGVSILVAEAVGSNNVRKVREALLIGLLVCLITTLIITYGLIEFLDPIFLLLGASQSLLPLIGEYMNSLLIGMPLLTFGMMAGANLRANGSIMVPDVIMGIAGIINLILDYVLIFGKFGSPEYGIQGAALATVISWIFVAGAMIFYLLKDKLLTRNSFKGFTNLITYSKNIFTLGTPVIVTQIIQPFTLMFITYLLAKNSEMAVAAFGVASRVEMLLMIGVTGVSMAITPFIAQNFGAKNKDRIDKAIAFGGRASTYIGLLICLILFGLGYYIAGIFSDSIVVIENTVSYFHWVSPSYIFYGIFIITSSIFNGLQLPTKSLRIMLVKTLAFTIPFTLTGSFLGVKGVFIGLSLSNIAGGIYASIVMRKDLKTAKSKLAGVHVLKEYKKDFSRLLSYLKGKRL